MVKIVKESANQYVFILDVVKVDDKTLEISQALNDGDIVVLTFNKPYNIFRNSDLMFDVFGQRFQLSLQKILFKDSGEMVVHVKTVEEAALPIQ